MNITTRTIRRLAALLVLTGLLVQGCAYPPQQPVGYPRPQPPPPVQKGPVPQEPVPDQSVPKAEPARPAPQARNPIAVSFSRQAAEQTRQGRLDLATATLERGLRAAPKDAMLWTELAEIKLQQGSSQQARAFAAKSNSLAGTDPAILKKNRRIIEESLRQAAGQ